MADFETNIQDIRDYWNANPVAAEGIDASPGSAEFYQAFDAIREAEDCEPYAYSDMIHGYRASSGKRVLDVGCGNGYVLSRYASKGAEVAGVDLTEKAVQLSRRRFELGGLKGDFKQIDGVGLPYPDSSFDIVCSMGVLHHIPDPGPTVDEMFRVLKPGGQAIIMLYHRYSYKYMVVFRLKRLADPRYKGMSQQDALNRNDGAGCPLAMVYSKTEARDLLHRFADHECRLNLLSWRQLFLLPHKAAGFVGNVLGSPSDTWLARRLGWNLYVSAIKPEQAA